MSTRSSTERKVREGPDRLDKATEHPEWLGSAHLVGGPPSEVDKRSRGESRQASGTAAGNVDVHQINCTFYDALGRRDDEYLVARALHSAQIAPWNTAHELQPSIER